MMSARRWRERRNFWPALIFWAWLASFVFGFAGGDLFHSPNCPEQLALHSATHSHDESGAHLSDAGAVRVSIECASCVLQLSAQGIIAALAPPVLPLICAMAFAILVSANFSVRAQLFAARGPPMLAI